MSMYELLEVLTDEQREQVADAAFNKAMEAVKSIKLTAADKKELSSALSSQIICSIEDYDMDKAYGELDKAAARMVKIAFER